jgi:DNA-binding beta-propeller fold protein YncE
MNHQNRKGPRVTKAKACFAALFDRPGFVRGGRRALAGQAASAAIEGSGALPRRRVLSLLAAGGLLILLGALSLLAAPVSADTSFGEEGNQAGVVPVPEGIAVDPADSDLYVADQRNQRIDKFDPTQSSLFAFGWGVADGAEAQQTCTLTCEEGFLTPFTHDSVKGAKLASPEGVAVDPSGEHDVYVEDVGYQRVEKFKPDGEFVSAFGGDVVAEGPGNSSTDERQQLTVTAEAGTFVLSLRFPFAAAYTDSGSFSRGETTALPYDATAAELEAALDAISTVGGLGGTVSVSGGPGGPSGSTPYEIIFQGALAGNDVPPLEAEAALTGAAATAEVQTVIDGGGAEICTPASGDVCKSGGDLGSGEGGTFTAWPENADLVAVGASGTVYVGDTGRVEKFDSAGSYLGQVDLPGAGPTEALAVDSSGNLYVISQEVPGVQEFDAAGTPVRTLDPGGDPNVIAVDQEDDLFLGQRAGEEYEFRAYSPTGTLVARFTSLQVRGLESTEAISARGAVNGIAVDSAAGKLYAANVYTLKAAASKSGFEEQVGRIASLDLPLSGPPLVTEEHVTDIEPTTATLRAVINPSGFDTHFHFQYITAAAFAANLDGGRDGFTGAQETGSTDLGSINESIPVQAAISGLAPETAYHFRAVAESSEGTIDGADQTYGSLPPVSVRDLTTQTVGPELVTLKAELDPNNGATTHYIFQIGNAAGDYSFAGSEGNLGAGGNEFEPITATFSGLQPGTVYHYRLLASNAEGPVQTADATFTTELSQAQERVAERCPNTNLREENSSLPLADCRAYEQVSPSFKAGYPVTTRGSELAPGGERSLFESVGVFAGAQHNELSSQYLAQRTEAGWVTQAVIGRPAGPEVQPINAIDFSADLGRWIFPELPGDSTEQVRVQSSSGFFSIGSADGTFLKAASPPLGLVEGPPRAASEFLGVDAQSDQLSRFFILTSNRLLPGPADPRPTDTDAGIYKTRVYEVAGAGSPDPTVGLVAETPLGLKTNSPVASGNCGIDQRPAGTENARFASADGTVLYYTVPLEGEPGETCGEGTPNPIGLFARTLGSAPQQLNVPPSPQCISPSPCFHSAARTPLFYGTSPSGTLSWFTTAQPLIDSDTDQTSDLYLARLEGPGPVRLTQASVGEAGPGHPLAGRGAEVEGVVQVSGDGSHVAFVARGALTEAPNSLGEVAAKGADNLYVYDAASSETRFVGRLCSSPEQSGSVGDSACPSGLAAGESAGSENDSALWRVLEAPQAAFTPDGGDLLFASYARLDADDTDAAPDVYRFDFRTGELIRVSFGHDGNDGDGNDSAYPAEINPGQSGTSASYLAGNGSRTIAADGATVIFQTAAPLVAHDTNTGGEPSCARRGGTGCDVYEWEAQGHGTCTTPGGCVSLASDGLDPAGASEGRISASGQDITFITNRSLVPADSDGIADVYDARINGGFRATPQPPPCAGPETCHPSSAAPPAAPAQGTESFVGPGNSPPQLHCGKGKVREKRHGQVRCIAKKHHKRKSHHKKKHHTTDKHHQRADRNRGGGK